MPKLITPPEPEGHASRAILIPPRIWDELDSYDKNLKSKFIRAFRFISQDLRHPSLGTEFVRVRNESILRARVDLQHRIHFELRENYYLILEIGGHRLQGIG